MTDVELIKSRLDIVDIVGEYLPLKPSGANMKAPCPFHDEKTPSFMVHRGKQIFHCFGCGEGGDMFTFIQKQENVDFAEALQILANKAGVQLKTYDAKNESVKNRLKTLMLHAVEYYCSQINTDAGAPARKYLLKDRALTVETVKDFQLGFAPDGWESIGPHLKSKGFTDEEIVKSGLVVQKEGNTRYYDRFRKRIMFPILDAHGLPIGFTARLLPEDEGKEKAGGKYINTPETMLYHKAYALYGLNHAKQSIKKEDAAVFVEGQMDVIASHQAGITSAIASSGTALTPDQFRIIKRFSSNIIFALDQDTAGINALKRSVVIAWQAECSAYVAAMPDGAKDPADLVREDASLWQHAVKNRVPFMDHIIEHVCSQNNLATADGKKQTAQELLPLLKALPDPIERSHYIDVLSGRLSVDANYIHEALSSTKAPTPAQPREREVEPTPSASPATTSAPEETRPVDLLIALALRNDTLIAELIHHIAPESTAESQYHEFYKFMHSWYSSGEQSHISHALTTSDNDVYQRHYTVLELLGEKEYGALAAPEVTNEFNRLVALHKKEHITSELASLEQQLKVQESLPQRDESLLAQLSRRFGELTKQLKNLS